MSIKNVWSSYGFSLLVALSLVPVAAVSQENTTSSQCQNESTIEGTVVSSSRQTFVVRTPDNQFCLFTFNRYTNKPQSFSVGARVRVESRAGMDTGSRLATTVTTLEAAPKDQKREAGTDAAPIPESVRNVESEIKSEARRWRLGVRAGAAFDPELFMFGVHSQMGPIFSSRVFFRPSAEFAFGEVTDLIALNLEGIYRFPRTYERKDWSPYVGAGPALTFIHQNFTAGRDIDFGNFDFDAGFNILAGMQSRRGTFVEAKTSLWSRPAPVLRLIVGYNF
jgi:opacity protein-like surface antigen